MALQQLATNETEQKRLTDIPLLAAYLKENEPPKNGAFVVTRIIEPATYDNYTIVIGDDLARCNVYPSNPVYKYLTEHLEGLHSNGGAMYVVLTNRVKGFWALSEDDEQVCDWSKDKLGYLMGKPKKRPKTPASTANLAQSASTANGTSA